MLAEAVEIPSVSGDAAHRPEVFRMADWLQARLEKLEVKVTRVELPKHMCDGQEIPLPPVLFGQYGDDPAKKTILTYGHMDVQPAQLSDGWDTDPFKLVHDEKTGRMYGRGSTDDKGPLLGWLAVIEAHRATNTPMPVNVKMVFEGMEESGSEGLEAVVRKEASGFLKDVDAVCISDNYWLGTKKPCLTYGLRGLSYWKVTIDGPAADLHSGVFGGTVHEPMTDLFAVFSKLVTGKGEILIPGINDLIAPLTDEERKRYEVMDFNLAEYGQAVGGDITMHDDGVNTLMGRMRFPSLSIHGIEGAFSAPGSKTVIPAKVSGKFSLRLVPNLTPQNVEPLVRKYLESEFAKLGSKNRMTAEALHGGQAWLSDPEHWNFKAAAKATKNVYGVEPDYTREGGSIPVTLVFEDALKKSVMLLPMGRADDGAHSINEKLDRTNYIQGIKLMAEYLEQVPSFAQ